MRVGVIYFCSQISAFHPLWFQRNGGRIPLSASISYPGRTAPLPASPPERSVHWTDPAAAPAGEKIRLQLFHQLFVISAAADAVQAPQPGQNHLHILRGEKDSVHPVAFHDADAPVRALDCPNRNPCPAQCFNISADGPSGHFEFLRQFRRSGFVLLQQDRKYADPPETGHITSAFPPQSDCRPGHKNESLSVPSCGSSGGLHIERTGTMPPVFQQMSRYLVLQNTVHSNCFPE